MLQNRKIEKNELFQYQNVIPDTYMEQLEMSRFYAALIYEAAGEETKALYITYSLDGWQELVWIRYYQENVIPMEKARILRYLLHAENQRHKNQLKGVFLERHIDELKDPDEFRHSLMMSGFECHMTYDNIYEFSLDQVKERRFLEKAAKALTCTAVLDASLDMLDLVDDMIQTDDRPVPVGLYVNWDEYLQEDSLICLKNGQPCGMLLISGHGEYLVIDCAYVTDKAALPSMLGNAFLSIEKKYGITQKILVPVVINRTASIVERMVLGASRGKMIEGVYRFRSA